MTNEEKREIVCDALEAYALTLPIDSEMGKTLMTAVAIMESNKLLIDLLKKDVSDYQDMLDKAFMCCDILIKALDKREGIHA